MEGERETQDTTIIIIKSGLIFLSKHKWERREKLDKRCVNFSVWLYAVAMAISMLKEKKNSAASVKGTFLSAQIWNAIQGRPQDGK